MTPEEFQKFFTERLDQNKEARAKQLEQIQQMQDEIETLRSFSLESESNRNILQIQGNTNIGWALKPKGSTNIKAPKSSARTQGP